MTHTTDNRLIAAQYKLVLLCLLQHREPTPATAAIIQLEQQNIARLAARKASAA